MRIDLLLALADHIEKNVADASFFMGYYWFKGKGCAAGHAAQMPLFKEAGLTMIADWRIYVVKFKEETGLDALALLFEMDVMEASHLFLAPSTTSRLDFVKKIRDFISERSEPHAPRPS